MGRQRSPPKKASRSPTGLLKKPTEKFPPLQVDDASSTDEDKSTLFMMEAGHAVQSLGLLYSLSLGEKLPKLVQGINNINPQQQLMLQFFLPSGQLSTNLFDNGKHLSTTFKPLYEDEFAAIRLMDFYKSIFRGNKSDVKSIEACVQELPSIFLSVNEIAPKLSPSATEVQKMEQHWKTTHILAAITFLPTEKGCFVPWIATSDTTNWLKNIYGNKAPSRRKTPVYGLVDLTTNFPSTPRRMGLGRLLLTTTTHTTTVFMGGKNQIRIFLQCNRAEEATMSFYTSNGFTVLTEKLDSAKEDEPESDERCHFHQVEDKKGNNLQSSHWHFGFVSIPCDIWDQMDESYPNMWFS